MNNALASAAKAARLDRADFPEVRQSGVWDAVESIFFNNDIDPYIAPINTYYSRNNASAIAYQNLKNYCEDLSLLGENISFDEYYSIIRDTHYNGSNIESLYGIQTRGEFCNIVLNMNWWYYNTDEVLNLSILLAIIIIVIIFIGFTFIKRKSLRSIGRDAATSILAVGIRAKRGASKRASKLADEAKGLADEAKRKAGDN